jgi:hypothetical protein
MNEATGPIGDQRDRVASNNVAWPWPDRRTIRGHSSFGLSRIALDLLDQTRPVPEHPEFPPPLPPSFNRWWRQGNTGAGTRESGNERPPRPAAPLVEHHGPPGRWRLQPTSGASLYRAQEVAMIVPLASLLLGSGRRRAGPAAVSAGLQRRRLRSVRFLVRGVGRLSQWARQAPSRTAGSRSSTNGCAIRENWMPLNGNAGGSLSGYDPATRRWHQTWIGSTPGVVSFEGRPCRGQAGAHRIVVRLGSKRRGRPNPP